MASPRSRQTVNCTSCNVAVSGAADVRSHYRSDLHLVNVKRRVSGLAPLSAADFSLRVQQLRASDTHARAGKRAVSCEVCNKRFSSEKAYANHELSRRHRDKLNAAYRGDADWMSSVNGDSVTEELVEHHDEQEESEEQMEAMLRRRLAAWRRREGYGGVFDDEWFDDAAHALEQLSRRGMFVPFRERLRDVAGLVQYLSQKVCVGHACVRCERTFEHVSDVRRHMNDVGHCAMTDDVEQWMLEFGEFYDWRADGAEHDEWEEVPEEDVLGEDVQLLGDEPSEYGDDMQVPVGALRGGGDADADADADADGEQVALAIGQRVMGHRSLRQFYKQRVRPADRSVAVVAARKERQLVQLSRRAEGGALPLRVARLAQRREARMGLLVARSNYYCRKARFKQKMVVLNSGYRA